MNKIEKLIASLDEVGLLNKPQDTEEKLTAEDIADTLWLLLYVDYKQREHINDDLAPDQPSQKPRQIPLSPSENIGQDTKPNWQFPPDRSRNSRSIELHTQRSNNPLTQNLGKRETTLVRSPAASALPSKLDIARALRPLMRPISSYTHFILDEQATTHHIAETLILDKQAAMHHSTETQKGIWTPVRKPALMRWLEVALVVDVGASMAPWRHTIDELRILLEHQGAFRDVRVWQLVTDKAHYISLYTGTNLNAQQERHPKELVDPTGRRLILLVSDCVSPAWHSGKVQQVLDLWGKTNVVTLVQVFPRRMWPRTALRTADIVSVRTKHLLRGNAGMIVQKESMDFAGEDTKQANTPKPSLPIPIITLEPEVIANWAHMIVGSENAWTLGAIFYQDLLALSEKEDAFSTQISETSPKELVEQFFNTASPTAQNLLRFLSAAPISLPVLRLIQQVMLPHAQQIHVAEVFLSGLFKEIARDETTNNPDYIEYDFLDGIREVLQETILIPDEFKVINAVSEYLGNRYGHLRDFYARATAPSNVKGNTLPIDQKSRPFARIVANAWRHLGGTYAKWAEELEREDAPSEPAESVSEPISKVAEDALPSPKAEHEEAPPPLAEPVPNPISTAAEDTLPLPNPIIPPEGILLLLSFREHKSTIKAVSWSPDGTLLACGSNDGTVQICSTSQGTLLYPPLKSHTSAIRSVTWSPSGKRLTSRSVDGATRVWDTHKGKLVNTSKATMNETSLEYWSPNGQLIAISPGDRMIRIWKQRGGELQWLLKGHTDQITTVSWSPDSKLLASGASDGTVRIWDTSHGEALHILEGYAGDVRSVSWSSDGKLLAFSSIAKNSAYTTNIHIWRTDTWEPVANLPDLQGEAPATWHPCPSDLRFPSLATTGQQPGEILVWQLDMEVLCATSSPEIVHYANAKVVLVGESGVGKSGLSLVLTGKPFVPTESTHNRHVWPLDKEEVQQEDGTHETREIWLWDLAGQRDYQLIHQLHLHEVTIALIVFDASRESDPFAGILHWQHALRLAQQDRGSSALPLTTWLVAARIDRGGRSVSRARIDNLVKELGCAGYIETSAKAGIGIAELRKAILTKIDWVQLPKVTSTRLLSSIKAFMRAELQAGRLLRTADELYETFLHTKDAPASNSELRQQFTIALGQLVAQGVIRSLGFGNLVLLQPERLDAYASALLIAVKNEPDELGSIPETRVLQRQFFVPFEDRLTNPSQEKLLLIAMIDELVRHEIALRESGFLVFPSQSTLEHPNYDELKKKQAVIFSVTGLVLSLYTTLVVRIAQSGIFHKQGLWHHVVTYTTRLHTSGTYGLLFSPKGEEQAELGIFFDEYVSEDIRILFEDFVRTYLERRTNLAVQRHKNFVCPNCGEIFTEAQISKRRERGFKSIRCNICETKVSLLDGVQRLATSTTQVKEMEQMADHQRDRESAALILQGKIATQDFDVFLCYNRQNKAAVTEISELLKRQNILPQLDEWHQRSSLAWKKLLEEQVARFKTVVFFIGKEGVTQGWPQQEFVTSSRDFVKRGSPMILALLPGAPQVARLPNFLNNMAWIDFRVNDPDPMQHLLSEIIGSKEIE